MAKRADELKSLRWGMFICWSFSTFSGKEWTPGVTDVSFFKATGCDTDQWARTAKEAGMGYILFLTKHHDGFCLWDTKTTDRKVTKSPLGRDVLAELQKSCDKHGIKLALYFSEGDWTWPARSTAKAATGGGANPEIKKAQLKELLTQYGPIEYIWFDHAVGDGGPEPRGDGRLVQVLPAGLFHRLQSWRPGGCRHPAGRTGAARAAGRPRGRGAVHERRAEQELSAGRVHLSDPAAARGRRDVVLLAADSRRALPSRRETLRRLPRCGEVSATSSRSTSGRTTPAGCARSTCTHAAQGRQT